MLAGKICTIKPSFSKGFSITECVTTLTDGAVFKMSIYSGDKFLQSSNRCHNISNLTIFPFATSETKSY